MARCSPLSALTARALQPQSAARHLARTMEEISHVTSAAPKPVDRVLNRARATGRLAGTACPVCAMLLGIITVPHIVPAHGTEYQSVVLLENGNVKIND